MYEEIIQLQRIISTDFVLTLIIIYGKNTSFGNDYAHCFFNSLMRNLSSNYTDIKFDSELWYYSAGII